jgi:hypothetical protein
MSTQAEGIDPADLTDEQLEALENSPDGSTPDAGTEANDEPDEQQATAPGAATSAAADPEPGTTDQTTADTTQDQPSTKPAGIASKNGKHVLPFHVLQAERRRADEAARRAAELERELADLKAGKQPGGEAADLTEEEVVQMEQDFPEHGKKLRAVFEKARQYEESARSAAKDEPADTSNPIQDAIDQIPLLVDWQATDPAKFSRAGEIDDVLKKSPKWQGKPLAERFAQAVRMVAEENDIPLDDEPAPSTSKPGNAQRKTPDQAIANAPRTRPNPSSDFKGGTVPDTDTRIDRLSPTAQVNRWADLSDDEIDAQLARMGG